MLHINSETKRSLNELNNLTKSKSNFTFFIKHQAAIIFSLGILLILIAYPFATNLATSGSGNSYEYNPEKAFYLIVSFFLSGTLICLWGITRKSNP